MKVVKVTITGVSQENGMTAVQILHITRESDAFSDAEIICSVLQSEEGGKFVSILSVQLSQ